MHQDSSLWWQEMKAGKVIKNYTNWQQKVTKATFEFHVPISSFGDSEFLTDDVLIPCKKGPWKRASVLVALQVQSAHVRARFIFFLLKIIELWPQYAYRRRT
jgi:hypothetical protein